MRLHHSPPNWLQGILDLPRLLSVPESRTAAFVSLYLHQIGIPSIATDMEVIIAWFLPRWLSKDMSYLQVSLSSCSSWRRRSLRYFDARTNRPAIRNVCDFKKMRLADIDTEECNEGRGIREGSSSLCALFWERKLWCWNWSNAGGRESDWCCALPPKMEVTHSLASRRCASCSPYFLGCGLNSSFFGSVMFSFLCISHTLEVLVVGCGPN